jgi:hypothetical protein
VNAGVEDGSLRNWAILAVRNGLVNRGGFKDSIEDRVDVGSIILLTGTAFTSRQAGIVFGNSLTEPVLNQVFRSMTLFRPTQYRVNNRDESHFL